MGAQAESAATRLARAAQVGGLIVDGDGNQRLQPHDIAVITPHVEQASAVAARPLAVTTGI